MKAQSAPFLVVAIGASAGGLEACKKLLDAMPEKSGLALILVQHLDPTHESLMVDLLAGHTSLVVRQAVQGMKVAPDHLFVIPPGKHLSVENGRLRLSTPRARKGVRVPFDFLLHSLAKEYGSRARCVILSGTGADGSAGLKAVKEAGGVVIAQDPLDAAYDGMPKSAIATGLVDIVAPAADIAAVLAGRRPRAVPVPAPPSGDGDVLSEVITLLRTRTPYDFRRYKRGTLQRRLDRRMSMAGSGPDNLKRYLQTLRDDTRELDLLAKDLLINVTGFFRDANVFDLLAKKVIPGLVAAKAPGESLRLWVAGCSTGEETYSLAMLFQDHIWAAKRNVKLQVFASDIDPDAVAVAREGFYASSIGDDIAPDRLKRYFVKENRGYRVSPELRSVVVFSVQDVLADPPFSRLDMVSCRNLLIYLKPEAQSLALSRFHFGLRAGGVLLLGGSESVGTPAGLFEPVASAERIFRRIGRGPTPRSETLAAVGARIPPRPGNPAAPKRLEAVADFCQRLAIDTFAPAAVLINGKNECLYSLGPTHRFLTVASGHLTHDLFAMVRPDLRGKLRSAVQLARREDRLVDIEIACAHRAVKVVLRPKVFENEKLLFVSFEELARRAPKGAKTAAPAERSRVAQLERELKEARTDLDAAVRNLEISSEEQRAINEEALSVNEEYQSTNEELLASKEELQSLNEELTALNSQLQEALELQRTTSDDLQNVLYSTNVATLFLDRQLNIRFFTPATKRLFNIIATDVGRPLTDLRSLAADSALVEDALKVLEDFAPIEREIEAQTGEWYVRRILPYRTRQSAVAGVVVTFIDNTERRRVTEALDREKRLAESANETKSRFLAAASHDLRQPLQTLALLQDQLAKIVDEPNAQKLIAKCDETLGSISSMLNALLDINQIEAGTIDATRSVFSIGDLFDKLVPEFAELAAACGLKFRAVACRCWIRSDPRLLEQMIRNLLSNALKYTPHGRVLLGCRRRGQSLRIEVRDTGIGIPSNELENIFREYHQLDSDSRKHSGGLGLGLAIVRRLGALLDHEVSVRSWQGKGSVFAIDVPFLAKQPALPKGPKKAGARPHSAGIPGHTVLVIEDDPELRRLLGHVLKDEGLRATTAPDGVSAVEMAARGALRPSLVLADYNLPNGMNGLEAVKKLREKLGQDLPVIVLTGDISTQALRDIAGEKCLQLNKPVKTRDLMSAIGKLLPENGAWPKKTAAAQTLGEPPVVYLIDDDDELRAALCAALEGAGRVVKPFADCETFLESYQPNADACLLVDAYLPGMKGLELLQLLRQEKQALPTVVITGFGDIRVAVQAMKAGAADFLEKPVGVSELLASIDFAIEQSRDAEVSATWKRSAAERIARLSARQREIMDLVLAGQSSKRIAATLHLSQRTVENHRAVILKKTGAKSLPALARLALVAQPDGT